MIRRLTALQDRPGGARRRPADAPDQGRHADDGRRADPGLDRRHDAAVGRPRQPLRLGRAARDARLRRDRLGRRLAQGRRSAIPKGLSARAKYFWQSLIGLVAARVPRVLASRRRQLRRSRSCSSPGSQSGFTHDLPPKADLIVPFFKTIALSARRVGLHRADVLRDRRHEQRGEPDRRPRRPRDHADGDGRLARSACSPTSSGNAVFSTLPAASRTSRAPASSRSSAARCRRGARLPLVQRLSGGGVHGRRRRARARRARSARSR